ncbi:restriction endonuclease subunit S [Clostridium tertium]|uniref:restriction endonuclease subunit S n=1 Tax=Clostridium tertium TaxID=1559 RepID=UPI00189F5E2D|nr:restriction endonuclease subunit S [Clostridium tertium]MDB1946383.1 restriction endonuclease subunit S [Clostridium tertium]
MNMMLEQFKTIFDRPEKVNNLRKTILDLAVRGKLVSQDPNDEPASVLLERIREEKEKLIKEKNIKKEKSLLEIDDNEKPFELPKGWVWTRLGELGITQTGTTPSTKNEEHFNGTVPFIKPADISENGINYENESLTELGLAKGRLILKNSVMMVCIGGSIGKNYYTSMDCSCNQQINAITPLANIDSKFVHYLLSNRNFYNKILELSTGSATPIINKSKWEQIIIQLPPLEEQKRIVKKVDSLMFFCDELEKALEKKVHYRELSAKSIFNAVGNVSTFEELEETLRFILLNFKDLSLGDNAVKELKKCILQLAIQGKLVPQDPNDEPVEVLLEKIREEKDRLIKENKIKKEKVLPEISKEEQYFKIPNGWIWIRLGQLFNIVRGSSPRPKGDPKYFTNTKTEYHWVTIKDISNSKVSDRILDTIEYLTYEGSLKSRYVEKDEIIIAVSGSVGKSAIMNVDGYIYDGLAAMKFIGKNIVLRDYIYNYFRGWKEKINNMSEGTSMPNINTDKLNMLVIPLPPLEEQKRINEKVDSLMILCDELENKIEEQRNYSNRLMESILKSSLSR